MNKNTSTSQQRREVSEVKPDNKNVKSSALSFHWKNFSSKYLFEFFIVFLGVYLAFVFTDYQETLREKKIRIKYYDSLIFEFEGFYRHLKDEQVKLDESFKLVESLKNGEQPSLVPVSYYYLYRGVVVDTAFNGNNFEAIDTQLLRSIISGVYLLEKLKLNIERFNELQLTVLYPAISNNQSFYDEEGSLLEAYQWYPKLVREIRDTNILLQGIVNEKAIPYMKHHKSELEKLPYWKLNP